jgi:phosphatidylinositol alpha-1,6-mannosyltransferase
MLPEGTRTVATVHGNDLTAPWQRTPGADPRRVIAEQLNRCDHVFAVSTHTAGLLDRCGVRAPVAVVTAGCDLDAFRPAPQLAGETRARYGLPLDVPLVLTVGRLAPRKGHFRVLAALERLPLLAHWAVVGSGPERDALVCAVDASAVRGRVTLLEQVSTEELPLLYNACDVFVLTPETRRLGELVDSEGFGLVYLEAAACAKPVVASALAGCRDAVVDGSTGLLVPPGDVRALAAAIERLLVDRDLARSFGVAGSAVVRASGGWRRLARETYDVYCELAEAQHGPAVLPAVVGPL